MTVDNIGIQPKMNRQITQAEGDDLLAVKHNQGKLVGMKMIVLKFVIYNCPTTKVNSLI
jgi:hypothetical protein